MIASKNNAAPSIGARRYGIVTTLSWKDLGRLMSRRYVDGLRVPLSEKSAYSTISNADEYRDSI